MFILVINTSCQVYFITTFPSIFMTYMHYIIYYYYSAMQYCDILYMRNWDLKDGLLYVFIR
jgi:hypothetical protein